MSGISISIRRPAWSKPISAACAPRSTRGSARSWCVRSAASVTACAMMFRLAKTASFRLPVMFAAIFGACFTILILITYFTASSAMREQVRRFIEEDTRALLAEVATDGQHSIITDINERLQDPEGPSDYYYFADSSGKKIVGNLDYMMPFEGWREAKFSARDLHDNKISAGDEHELWGKGTMLADGSFLFAGEDAYSVIVAQDAIL